MSPNAPGRSRLPGSRLLLAAAGCLAGLLLAELVVRAAGAAPAVAFIRKDQFQLSGNLRIGWEPIPNPTAAGGTLDPRWSPEQRNSLGFRDYEHSVEKVPGVFRILVLGDSIAKGLGIPDPRLAFPMVMETRLREQGLRAEVLNFGVEGYNTQQEVETLKDKGLVFSPDLVVLAYSLNDRDWPAHHLYRDMLAEESGRGAPSAVRLSPWLRHSALYLFLRFRVLGPAPSGEGPDDARVQRLFDLVQRDTVDEYFGVLAELSRRHGFRVLVAVFPYLDDLTSYRHMDENRRMADLSSRSGFLHLDLLPVFLDCERRAGQTIAFDEVHPNNIGHICAGRAVASFVATRVLPGAREDG